MPSTFRSTLVLALCASALSAQALDAFSSLDPAPNRYSNVTAYDVSSSDDQGFQFVTTAGGTLTGFQVAMNNLTDLTPTAFNFSLYTDSGSDTLGSLLGSWVGTSTGVSYPATNSALASITATGPAINLTSGTKYWVYATPVDPNSVVFWSGANSGTTTHLMGGFYGSGSIQAAFSVQVRSAVPGPAAALAFAVGTVRRRKKASRSF